ncbi:hypothetical protein FPQ18DRAFT_132404 [Pyronema domesticum]|nr:hypothetical protein FPQ18DRAFT_132404 [Pyronema domesticum]
MGSIEMMRENLLEIPERMQQISDRLTTVISLVSDLARSSDEEIKRISEKVEKLDVRSKDEELEKIIQSISPLEPHERHYDIKSKRLENTGGLFLQTDELQTWRNTNPMQQGFSPICCCYGIPGAGKSIMSSLVVDRLLERASNPANENRICVAYVYCDYRDEANQTAVKKIQWRE